MIKSELLEKIKECPDDAEIIFTFTEPYDKDAVTFTERNPSVDVVHKKNLIIIDMS